jgi:hypothetical protein
MGFLAGASAPQAVWGAIEAHNGAGQCGEWNNPARLGALAWMK